MRWVFAIVATIVLGGVGAFAVYTFGWHSDAETSQSVTVTRRVIDVGAADARAVWEDFHTWECPAYARSEKEDTGRDIDTSSCEDESVKAVTRVRRGLWRVRVRNPDHASGGVYADTCYAIEPDKYEPPTLANDWPYIPPGMQLLRDCPS